MKFSMHIVICYDKASGTEVGRPVSATLRVPTKSNPKENKTKNPKRNN